MVYKFMLVKFICGIYAVIVVMYTRVCVYVYTYLSIYIFFFNLLFSHPILELEIQSEAWHLPQEGLNLSNRQDFLDSLHPGSFVPGRQGKGDSGETKLSL